MSYKLRTFNGTVVRFFREQGYGFISVDGASRDARFHLKDGDFGGHEIKFGTRLEFYLVDGPKGLNAVRVSLK